VDRDGAPAGDEGYRCARPAGPSGAERPEGSSPPGRPAGTSTLCIRAPSRE
jgi:hypothetical protein